MRRVILTTVVALLVVSSGCVGLITGETVAFEANNATVEDEALSSTDYELNNSSTRSLTRDVEFFGQERTIRVVNEIQRYTSNGSLADIADNETMGNNETLRDAAANETGGDGEVAGLKRFVVVSSPGATVAGRSLNPAASWSNERILEQVADQTGQLNDLESDGNRTIESLGEEREVSAFNATTQIKGREVEVRAHVVSFEHEGDVVIAVAVHPAEIDEQDNVDELIGSIEHSGS